MTEATARGIALTVLTRVEARGAYANLVLADVLARSPLAERDRAFCTELVNGSLRMRSRLDFYLDRLLARPLVMLPPPVRNLLRLSLYQLEFLPGLPPYAVVDEAVALARRRGFSGFAGLVNAVLRAFLRRRATLALPGREDPGRYMTITQSHPSWLADRWLARLGGEEAMDLADADNRPAPVVLRVNTVKCGRDRLMDILAGRGIRAEACALAPEGVSLSGGGAVEGLPGFAEGLFIPQDEGAMLVSHALAPAPGERLLDMCAAPGGKATHLAALAADAAEVIALDDHGHKIALIEENCRRLELRSVAAQRADAREFRPDGQFDGVLLDAPCSGTGVLRRRADLRWRRRSEDLPGLAALQRQLLQNAASLVRPGGRLVYSTCSLEPEENEEQMRWFLENYPEYERAEVRRFLPKEAAAVLGGEGWLHLWPHRHGTDGFFICRLERRM